ncbi:DUF4493 domain-containing protein [Parabacteroides distasonis]|uniref:DUF4493 domain-containing protein n=1 Tax=Parabacteroides distasonis TaxID=823 RepID=UPI003D047A9F
MMHKQFLYLLPLMGLLSFAACTNEENPLLSGETGEIRFSVVDTTQVEVETKAITGLDVNDFNVALSRNNNWIFSSRKYKDIAGTSISCEAGTGYLTTAESCTEGEAERANNGWGQVRVAGKMEFTVKPIEPTEVRIQCALANTSVRVVFRDYVKELFADYAITLHAADAPDRPLTFDKDNHSYKTAYFNVGEAGRALQYTASLTLPGAKEPHTYSNVLTLEPSHSYHLTVKLDDESKSKISIGIMVDGTLVEEKTFTEIINPYE